MGRNLLKISENNMKQHETFKSTQQVFLLTLVQMNHMHNVLSRGDLYLTNGHVFPLDKSCLATNHKGFDCLIMFFSARKGSMDQELCACLWLHFSRPKQRNSWKSYRESAG